MQITFQLIKEYYTAFSIGAAIFGVAWYLKSIRDSLNRTEERLHKIGSNHLAHLQASGEKIGEELSALRESGGRNEAQHDQQIDLLHDIREELRK